jgi:hypothetical protein
VAFALSTALVSAVSGAAEESGVYSACLKRNGAVRPSSIRLDSPAVCRASRGERMVSWNASGSAPESPPETVSEFYAAFTIRGTGSGCPTDSVRIILGRHWGEQVELRNNICVAAYDPNTSANCQQPDGTNPPCHVFDWSLGRQPKAEVALPALPEGSAVTQGSDGLATTWSVSSTGALSADPSLVGPTNAWGQSGLTCTARVTDAGCDGWLIPGAGVVDDESNIVTIERVVLDP